MAVVLSRKRDADYIGALLNQLERINPDFYLDGASIGGRYFNRLPVSKRVRIYNEPWYVPYDAPQGPCPLLDYPDEYIEQYNFVNMARVRNVDWEVARETGIFTGICYILDDLDGVQLINNPDFFRRMLDYPLYKNSYWVAVVDIHY